MVSSKALIRAQWKAGTILHQILYQICILHYSMEVQLLTSKFNLHKLVISCPKWASSFASWTPLCFFLTCHSLYLLSLSDKYSLVDNISPVLSVLEVTTQRSFHGVLLFCNYSCEIKKKRKRKRDLPTPLWASKLVNSIVPLWPFLGFSWYCLWFPLGQYL